MRIRHASPSRPTLAAAGLILSAALAGCAAIQSSGSAGDPIPLAVKAVGPTDRKDNRAREESRRLAGVQGVWRHGGLLTVDTEEGIQYRFVDAGVCEGFYTCRRWTFRGSAQTLSRTPNSHAIDYWLIEFAQGEGGYWLAINVADGSSTVLDTEPVISPDKSHWATGECNDLSGDNLKMLESDEYGRLILVAEAGDAPCCEIEGWDGAALKVKSCDPGPDKGFEDRLIRQANGSWAGKRIRFEKPKTP